MNGRIGDWEMGRWGDGETWRLDELRLCVFARGGLCEREKGRIGEWVILKLRFTNYEFLSEEL